MYPATETNFGIRVIIFKDKKVLLGKNKGGNLKYFGLPGGHLEYIVRECLEPLPPYCKKIPLGAVQPGEKLSGA